VALARDAFAVRLAWRTESRATRVATPLLERCVAHACVSVADTSVSRYPAAIVSACGIRRRRVGVGALRGQARSRFLDEGAHVGVWVAERRDASRPRAELQRARGGLRIPFRDAFTDSLDARHAGRADAARAVGVAPSEHAGGPLANHRDFARRSRREIQIGVEVGAERTRARRAGATKAWLHGAARASVARRHVRVVAPFDRRLHDTVTAPADHARAIGAAIWVIAKVANLAVLDEAVPAHGHSFGLWHGPRLRRFGRPARKPE
jgi:hypothetical protein